MSTPSDIWKNNVSIGLESTAEGDGISSTLDIYSLNKAMQAYMLHQDEITRCNNRGMAKITNFIHEAMHHQDVLNQAELSLIKAIEKEIKFLKVIYLGILVFSIGFIFAFIMDTLGMII